MNVQTASLTMITEVEYLEGERLSDIRHEYLAGQVYAMAGTSKVHNLIAGNLYSIIRSHITGKLCQAFMSDMKVRLADQNTYYYGRRYSYLPFKKDCILSKINYQFSHVLRTSDSQI